MREAKHFEREVQRRYPGQPHLWPEIAARVERLQPDAAFARTSENPMDRRLHFCLYFLATIQTLEARGAGFEEIRSLCLAITTAYVQPRHAGHAWLKRLPVLLMRTPLLGLLTGWMHRRTGTKGHADGFLVQLVTDRAETNGLGFGFDILECAIVKLFRKHGAERYVTILCEVDELTSALAGLELIRSGTIARGARRCDFRFRRKA